MKNLAKNLILFLAIILYGCERPTENMVENDGIPPAVPIGLSIYSAYDGEIVLDWRANVERDLASYNIFRSTNDSNYFLIETTSNDFYFDDSLDYTTTYYYKVSAVDFFDLESETSQPVSAMPKNLYKPNRIRFPKINARNWEGEKSIYLSWEKSFESDIAGYNIYRDTIQNFSPDSTNLIDFSSVNNFSDTINLNLYTEYFYNISPVDKGGLIADPSNVISDEIYEVAEVIFPTDNYNNDFFSDFKIMAIDKPAEYQIVVQENQYFGEFWRSRFSSQSINDTISVRFNPNFLETNKPYYWRVITFSRTGQPNSISKLYKFTIKQ